jgi:regulatory protein
VDDLNRALDLAFRYLGRRDRTVAEVRRHLEAKRVEPSVIEQVIEELHVQGYLDDARYAQRFAEDRRALDGWGSERIERKLAGAGVSRDDIAAAIAAQSGQEELGAALEVLRRRFRVPPETERDRERALGLLVRRGYELEIAYDAVRALEREASSAA